MTLLAKYQRILGYARSESRSIAVALALSGLLAAGAALQPWPLKLLVDYGIGGAPLPAWLDGLARVAGVAPTPLTLIIVGALAGIAIFALTVATESALTISWSRTGQRLVYGLATHLLFQLQRLSMRFHATRTVGDALSRITGDAWSVYAVTEGLVIAPVRHVCVLAFVGVLAWQLNAQLTLVLIASIPLLAVSTFYFGVRIKRAERAKRESVAGLTAFVHQVLGAIPIVQAFASEARNVAVFGRLSGKTVRANEQAAFLSSAYSALNGVSLTVGIALVVFIGGSEVIARQMALGSLLVFIAYARSIDSASRALLRTYGGLRGAEASVDRVLEVLDERDRIEDARDAYALPDRSVEGCGRIVFDNVSFGYTRGRAVLTDLSLEISPGETLALVGATGAGKTTLASLVPRFFDPSEGRVLLDGHDLRHLTVASLRSEIALVLQDPFILPITALQNIAYGRPEATREDIIAAAVAANAHEFIRELPDGYDSVLGEQGATLSGGQQQRIAIARALLKNPRVLILDEPTSALDTTNEEIVLAALERLLSGRTTIIIAHRLATIRRADRIAVMEHGRIVELGSHAELLAAGKTYARLYALSAFGASEPEPRP